MIGADQKKYPVPMNYSSKTKLIPGDTLKLKVMPDGKFIYKKTKTKWQNLVRQWLKQ